MLRSVFIWGIKIDFYLVIAGLVLNPSLGACCRRGWRGRRGLGLYKCEDTMGAPRGIVR